MFSTFTTIISTLGIITSIILLNRQINDSVQQRVLSSVIFCFSLLSLTFNLIYTRFFYHFPHLWRLPVFFSLSMMPLSYLYVRSVFEQQFRLRKLDYWFFLPAFLYTLTFLQFYILSADEKRVIIAKLLEKKELISLEIDGTLPRGIGIIFRAFWGLSFSVAQFQLISKWSPKVLKGETNESHNVYIAKWLNYFTWVMFISWLLFLVLQTMQVLFPINLYVPIAIIMSVPVIFISSYLLLKPYILYGINGIVVKYSSASLSEGQSGQVVSNENNDGTSLTEAEVIQLRDKIENYFLEQKPYLKMGYKIKDLSLELKVPVYILSAFINQKYSKNFKELINDYRINYAIELLNASATHREYTIEGIAKLIGYGSRNSFIAAIKKRTGKTPSEFISGIVQNS